MKNKWFLTTRIITLFVLFINLLLLFPVSRRALLHVDDTVRFSFLKSLVISPLGFYQDLSLVPQQLFFSFIISTIALCVLILMSKNFARIIFIVFQCAIILFGIIVMILFIIISRESRMYWIFDTFIRICLFPSIYCVIFSLPGVRKNFQNDKSPAPVRLKRNGIRVKQQKTWNTK
ncbi:MAG: hypothetical protein PHP17_00490 [Candidatus Omnitrophica bacterium]|nr:hypothetical protein [Candidatus Omnitrophota bacterium]